MKQNTVKTNPFITFLQELYFFRQTTKTN